RNLTRDDVVRGGESVDGADDFPTSRGGCHVEGHQPREPVLRLDVRIETSRDAYVAPGVGRDGAGTRSSRDARAGPAAEVGIRPRRRGQRDALAELESEAAPLQQRVLISVLVELITLAVRRHPSPPRRVARPADVHDQTRVDL